jgi:hypothetical protein
MKESDYIKASNLDKFRVMGFILSDCLPGDNWGINKEDLVKFKRLHREIESKLYDSIGNLSQE